MSWSATVIFCDDIRQEMNGKFFIIGAYTSEIAVFTNPAYFSIGTYIPLSGLEGGLRSYRCSVWLVPLTEGDGERMLLGESVGELNINKPELAALLCPSGLSVTVTTDCLLEVQLAFDHEPDRTIGSIPVRIITPAMADFRQAEGTVG